MGRKYIGALELKRFKNFFGNFRTVSKSFSHVINQRNVCTLRGLSKDFRSEVDPSEPIYTDPSLFEVASSSSDQNTSYSSNFHLI